MSGASVAQARDRDVCLHDVVGRWTASRCPDALEASPCSLFSSTRRWRRAPRAARRDVREDALDDQVKIPNRISMIEQKLQS